MPTSPATCTPATTHHSTPGSLRVAWEKETSGEKILKKKRKKNEKNNEKQKKNHEEEEEEEKEEEEEEEEEEGLHSGPISAAWDPLKLPAALIRGQVGTYGQVRCGERCA
ncbi:hypothetical protein E2C01_101224 [Portunus trituberculatus]|uniref:Uncharacterized protein n=1 Tax=Portunus trituberculatus TaxID=210409 RepID=A0A5B7KJL1_PORTR|nr:hypothetical protein [Portunus trituberculatus]